MTATESFDMGDTIAPSSEQLDAVDLLTGPRTFTIESVSKGNDEQPFNLHLAEFPRPWRPGKSMRRVLVACWGRDAKAYVGRRVTLFCDPKVMFGGAAVGGVRISHLSHIDKRKPIPLLVSRGKSAMFVVDPLPDDAPAVKPAKDRAEAAVKAFARLGVTPEQLEARVGHGRDEWTAQDFAALEVAFASIRGGESTVDEAFPQDAGPTDDDLAAMATEMMTDDGSLPLDGAE